MQIVDVVLVVLLVAALAVGLARGLFASLFTLLGVALGAIAAYWAIPFVNDLLTDPAWRAPAGVLVGLLLVGLGAGLGAGLGGLLRRGVDRTPLRVFDRLLGGVVGALAGALAIALVAPAIVMTGTPVVAPALAGSAVVRTIDQLTPRPVAAALAEVRGAVMDDAIPRLGELLGPVLPGVAQTVPDVDLDDPELARAAASVARITGVAYACGVSSSGSGFVAAPDRVVTNAHVVAGVDAPVVELPGGEVAEGRVVYFDPVGDLAVIATAGLDAAVLPLADTLAPGDEAVVQGYPYGGPFTSVGARVLSAGVAQVPDIYDAERAPRDIYALAADVRPGNSGGPLLTPTGEVAGVVFARADDGAPRGYASTPAEVAPVIAEAPGLVDAVGTGACTR